MSAPQKTASLVVVCSLGLVLLLLPIALDARKSRVTLSSDSPTSIASEQGSTGAERLSFIANEGQYDQSVRFRADAGPTTLWFTDNAIFYQLTKTEPEDIFDANDASSVNTHSPRNEHFQLVKVSLQNSLPNPLITGSDKQTAVHNYFIGNTPENWHANVPLYSTITYAKVYPGIDLVYYGTNEYVEYDFRIEPGANPSDIQLTYEGIQGLSVTKDGELAVQTALGTVIEGRPVVFQTNKKGKRTDIRSEYVLKSANTISFKIGHGYDPKLPLTIDPVIRFSTFLGGTANDFGRNVAVNTTRNAFVVGYTAASNFPVQAAWDGTFAGGGSGSYDAFLSKFSNDGDSLIFSTFFGGATGEDKAFSVDIATNGRATVTGSTGSTDFPTANPFQGSNGGGIDAFVVQFSVNGDTLRLGTYLGGTGTDEGIDIALNSSNLIHVAGYTLSSNFPLMVAYDNSLGGTRDGFVTKFSAPGATLAFSTFLGGSLTDDLYGIAIDKTNNIYVAGSSTSNDFPKINAYDSSFNGGTGSGDIVVAKFASAGGTPTYSTYIGTSGDEAALDIAVDTLNRPYICGYTSSASYPLTNAADTTFQGSFEGIVTRLSSSGTSLSYSTFLGGSANDFVNSIAVDNFGQTYVTGNTTSASGFPLADAFQSTLLGTGDAFITCLNLAGNGYVYSTLLGGQFQDFGYGIAIDVSTDSMAYVTGYTGSGNFPLLNPFQNILGGSSDAFLTAISTTPYICFDSDQDGYGDPGHPENECPTDNCPSDSNPAQTDTDSDGLGNPCDNCPTVNNASQADSDGDGIGDACDVCTDTDGDGFGNPGFPANTCPLDNCPSIANPDQANADGDGLGNICDDCTDTDGDGFGNPGYPNNTCPTDNCPTNSNASQTDTDTDGIGNVCDNCPSNSNANQANADGDAFGDACDVCTDTDGDGFGNPGYPANTCPVDNCPFVFNPTQSDTNGNNIGDVCDVGCCVGMIRGNVNGSIDNNITVADLTYLIQYIWNSGPPPPCPDEANINGSPNNSISVADVTYLVAFLFNSGIPPAACP